MTTQEVPWSAQYWDDRYSRGGNSGAGSSGVLGRFKCSMLHALALDLDVKSILDLGVGDGGYLPFPPEIRYTGADVSEGKLANLRSRFEEQGQCQFVPLAELGSLTADMTLSIDVTYHLVEEAVFRDHCQVLFEAADRYVVIYSANGDPDPTCTWMPHVKHRRVIDECRERFEGTFRLVRHFENPYPYDRRRPEQTSFASFYLFSRLGAR